MVVTSARGRREGGKWFYPAPLMGLCGFGGEGHEQRGWLTRVHGTSAIPPVSWALKCSGGGGRDIYIGRWMSGPRSDAQRSAKIVES